MPTTPTSPDRLHKTVLVSGGIWLVSFPLVLVYLAIIGMIGSWFRVDFASPEDATAELVLNLIYMAMVLGTLGVGVVFGLSGWRRHGLRLALAAAVLCIVNGVLFVVLPLFV